MIEQLVIARLLSDTTITSYVGDRIHLDRDPRDTTPLPWIRVRISEEAIPEDGLEDNFGIEEVTLEIDILTSSYIDRHNLARAVRSRLDLWSENQIHECFYSDTLPVLVVEGFLATLTFDVHAYTDLVITPATGGTAKVITTGDEIRLCGELVDCDGDPIQFGDVLPDQTGNAGKYLKTDGSTTSWSVVDSLPAQTGQSGKFLSTNGTAASWSVIPAELPSQSGNSGKYLTTNGTAVSWGTVNALPNQTGNAGKVLTSNGATAGWSSVIGGQLTLEGATAAALGLSVNGDTIFTVSGDTSGPVGIGATNGVRFDTTLRVTNGILCENSGVKVETTGFTPMEFRLTDVEFGYTSVFGQYDGGLNISNSDGINSAGIGVSPTSVGITGALGVSGNTSLQGTLNVTSGTTTTGLTVFQPNGTTVNSTFRATSSATANLTEWTNTSNVAMVSVTPAGRLQFRSPLGNQQQIYSDQTNGINSITVSTGRFFVQGDLVQSGGATFTNVIRTTGSALRLDMSGATQSQLYGTWFVEGFAASQKGFYVKAASGQTANLFELQNNGGTAMTSFDKLGAWQPASMTDANAPNNSVYYSTTQNKLTYKNSSGSINTLY